MKTIFKISGLVPILLLSTVVNMMAATGGLPEVIESRFIRLELSSENGSFRILDKNSGVWWESNINKKRLGEANITIDGKKSVVELSSFKINKKGDALELNIPAEGKTILVKIELLKPGNIIEFSYFASDGITVEKINLLDKALWIKDDEAGYFVVPVREGLIIPADSGKSFTHTFSTFNYEGCHIEMFGAVKKGSALFVTWRNSYVSLIVDSQISGSEKKSQTVSSTLSLSKSAKKFQIHFLGKGDYVDIGKAYREIAKNRGWFVSWDEKLKGAPERNLLFGSANIKLWSALTRRMSEDSTKELSVRVNWTFDEAATVAEHIKKDLRIEKVLFTVGGWIRRGYDNQHPDVLPAAPECGGNEKLAECSRRVKNLGYLFCLHDNYQDIYRDSPSWNEDFIMKNPEGKLVPGGVWAGGRAYVTCSLKALELAKRPQNLPAVKKLTDANAYFIDTTYAAGLYECYDPKHPLTREDDMKWKQALSDYARSLFGVFGSECGREWAIPHADFFEGLTGVSGKHYHDGGLENKVGGYVVPLFEIVYRDCIAMYGKYGYDINTAAGYVLDHIIYGRPLNYHNIPAGLYWTKSEQSGLKIKAPMVEFKQVSADSFEISYNWEVEKAPETDYTIFVHFTDKNGKILLQNDHKPEKPMSQWKPGINKTGPFRIRIPAAVQPPLDIRIGLYSPEQGTRIRLIGKDDGESRYIAGIIKSVDNALVVEPVKRQAITPGVFVKADNGWADGLHPTDRFIKNTCEVLNPLNELTSKMQMTEHRFLSADKKVQRAVFGAGSKSVAVLVNSGKEEYEVKTKFGGDITIPEYGFIIESPNFIAFHSLNWNGVNYDEPVLFTVRSLDGREILRSKKIRIFHGFGNEKIKIGESMFSVKKESTVSL